MLGVSIVANDSTTAWLERTMASTLITCGPIGDMIVIGALYVATTASVGTAVTLTDRGGAYRSHICTPGTGDDPITGRSPPKGTSTDCSAGPDLDTGSSPMKGAASDNIGCVLGVDGGADNVFALVLCSGVSSAFGDVWGDVS